ncbi:flavin reductase family protein [Planctomycetota bacterium]
MARAPVTWTDFLPETMAALREPGCLLVSQAEEGKPNAMTIGWGTVGVIWGRPMFLVLVRHSRYTWRLLEAHDEFTVNVPPIELSEVAVVCGTQSGRDVDKFAECGLTAVAGQHVRVPVIAECAVHYECRTVHRSNVDPTHLATSVLDECYGHGDFHTIYYGHILGVTAADDAREKLGT